MCFEVTLNHCELDHGEEIDGEFFVACGDAPGLFEPPDASLHDIAASIGVCIESGRSSRLTTVRFGFLRNHRTDSSPTKPPPNPRHIVSLVSRDALWSPTSSPTPLRHANGIDHRFKPFRFMPVPGGHMHGQGSGLTVHDPVDFAPKPASRAPQRMIGRFVVTPFFPPPAADTCARMLLPSTHHRSQSMQPCSSSRIWRCSKSGRIPLRVATD